MAQTPDRPPPPRTRFSSGFKEKALRRLPFTRSVLLHRDFLRDSGWLASGRSASPVDSSGDPLPWYTYPAVHFIEQRLRADMRVFEYGSGNSTRWWSSRVADVRAVESDAAWFARISPTLPANSSVAQVPASDVDRYASAAIDAGGRFDVIVIDGDERDACALQCLPALASGGVIIWDNSDWSAYWEVGLEHLREHGFRELPFHGLGPINWRPWTTSIWYRSGNNSLGI